MKKRWLVKPRLQKVTKVADQSHISHDFRQRDYVDFWTNIHSKNFFDFQVSAGDLEEMKIEYARYNNDLATISKFSAILSVH